HHARPRRRGRDRGRHRRDVRGARGRARPGLLAVRATAPSVHLGSPGLAPADRRRAGAPGADPGTATLAPPAAGGVQVPAALLVRVRPLPGRAPGGHAGELRREPSGRLLPRRGAEARGVATRRRGALAGLGGGMSDALLEVEAVTKY